MGNVELWISLEVLLGLTKKLSGRTKQCPPLMNLQFFFFFFIWKIHKVVYELSQLFKFNSIKNLFIFSFFFLFFFFNKPSLIFSFRFSFNRKVDLKQKTIIHKQAYELLGLIQNNSNINSFTSLYMLAKYNYYTYFNNDMANMRPPLIILIFSFL